MTPHPEGATHPFPIHAGSVTALPFADNSFDHITNLHALHHLRDAETVVTFLAECKRVLKVGGTLRIIDFPASRRSSCCSSCCATGCWRSQAR